jgi:hypothetical protein
MRHEKKIQFLKNGVQPVCGQTAEKNIIFFKKWCATGLWTNSSHGLLTETS